MTNALSKTSVWTYRSLKNTLAIATDFHDLEEGRANLVINIADDNSISGTIGGDSWSLDLKGSIQYGNPATLWFQGFGKVGDDPWIYSYLCYQVPVIPNGIDQLPVLVGSVTRVIPHPGDNGTTSPAGAVYSFYAILQTTA
jgi:hypothetical protein